MNVIEARRTRIPAGGRVLGYLRIPIDISSEFIHSLLPVFLMTTLDASALTFGFMGQGGSIVLHHRPQFSSYIMCIRTFTGTKILIDKDLTNDGFRSGFQRPVSADSTRTGVPA